MKATETNLLAFLRKSPQFNIPIFQRTYSWTESQCKQLWDDILQAGANEEVSAHFIGSIVYIETGPYQISSELPLLVIDGQQRLTTVALIIEALARGLGDEEPIEGFSARKLRNYYLLNPEEAGTKRYKLLLTQTDEQTLLAIVEGRQLPESCSVRLRDNFQFFRERIAELDEEYTTICKGLVKLILVDISLNREHDNPQLIFESMNSTGLELSQADLIRNYVLMDLESDHQERLYSDHWRPMELAFGQEAYSKQFDSFMRHYLTIKTGEIPRIGQVYERFKKFAKESEGKSVDALLADLHVFAGYYCAIALGKEKESRLSSAFRDLRELKVDVSYPFLLALYADHSEGILSLDEFVEAVRYVESYVFRRAVCSIPTNSLNKTFATLDRSIKKDKYLESLIAYFQQLPSYRRFPSDEEFVREIKTRNLYNNRTSYWLRKLENHDRKEPVPVDEFTVEHILPQNENLSKDWRNSLGEEWKSVQETWLHTLGNLTLSGYNAEYSDRPFAQKRDISGGFRQSPLRLNEGLGELEDWNEASIRNRANRLASKALRVWRAPSLDGSVLEQYATTSNKITKTYVIEDHQYLNEGNATRGLFEEFRREVLAIDPCVSEEFLKLYVAYKAETNFVDVIPQAASMNLILNMKFHELHDPREFATDISNIGRWGNGDVEIRYNDSQQLQYIMGLVRQAYERQMGEGEQLD